MNKEKKDMSLVTKVRQDRTILLVALLFGAVAVILLMLFVSKKEKMYGTTVPILVAAADIQKGETFSHANMDVKEIPQSFVTPNAITPDYLTSILDAKTIVAISKGQQLSWNFPEVAEAIERLSAGLSKEGNERAVTINVDEVSGVAGHVAPNDRVDVIGTFKIMGKQQGSRETITITKTKTILQCVTVLAVGSRMGTTMQGAAGQSRQQFGASDAYTSVTLKATPEEAALLTFAENSGNLRLLLRNPDDLEVSEDIPQIDFTNLFDIERKITRKVKIRVHQEGQRR